MVRKDHVVEFRCVNESCRQLLAVSMLEMENNQMVCCHNCAHEYALDREFLVKIRKFEQLIASVREARDILGDTHVAIDVHGHAVQIPYRLLLTRLNMLVTLNVGGKHIQFRFRTEPLEDENLAR